MIGRAEENFVHVVHLWDRYNLASYDAILIWVDLDCDYNWYLRCFTRAMEKRRRKGVIILPSPVCTDSNINFIVMNCRDICALTEMYKLYRFTDKLFYLSLPDPANSSIKNFTISGMMTPKEAFEAILQSL